MAGGVLALVLGLACVLRAGGSTVIVDSVDDLEKNVDDASVDDIVIRAGRCVASAHSARVSVLAARHASRPGHLTWSRVAGTC